MVPDVFARAERGQSYTFLPLYRKTCAYICAPMSSKQSAAQ